MNTPTALIITLLLALFAPVVWCEIEVTQSGNYEVEIALGCPPADAGSRIRVSAGKASVEVAIPTAPAKEIELPHRDEAGKTRYRNLEWATLTAGTLNRQNQTLEAA